MSRVTSKTLIYLLIFFILAFAISATSVSASTVSITPSSPMPGQALTCTVAGGTSGYYYFYWYKNGQYQTSYQTNTIPTGITASGETWKCKVYIPGMYYVGEDSVTLNSFSASCTAAQTSGSSPLNVSFDSAVIGGSGSYSYSWNFGDNSTAKTSSSSASHMYVAGTFNPLLTVTDTINNISVNADCPQINVGAILVSISPHTPNPGQALTCTVAGGTSGYYYFYWYKNGQYQTSYQTNTIPTGITASGETWKCKVYIPGMYYVGEDSVQVSTLTLPTLTVQNINCFSRVISGNNQSCSVTVTSSDGLVPGNVNVNIYYSDGTSFGSCLTNTLSGACAAMGKVGNPGTYTVYATASGAGYISDTTTKPSYTFDVYTQRYNIMNLATYNDSNFLYPSQTFYRGQALYAKFQVYDPINSQFVSNDIVTAATLVSLAGGRADLTRISYTNNWYYYRLDAIPLNHQFIGNSNVFAFAFNFTGLSGGQAQVALTILNNNPTISSIPDVYVNVGGTTTVNLNNYGHDLEDSTLQWNLLSTGYMFSPTILAGNVLSITGTSVGNGVVTLRGYDLDNAYVDTSINVHVNQVVGNNTITVSCIATPLSGNSPLDVTFNAIASGGSGSYNYQWNFGDGGAITTNTNGVVHRYNNVGTFLPTLTVVDSNNNMGVASCGLITATGGNGTGNKVFNMGGPYTGYINEPLTFDASKSVGSISKYSWNFGDGTTADTASTTIQHTYTAIDIYNVSLTITYTDGTKKNGMTTATIIEHSSPPPVVQVTIPDRGILVENILLTGGDSGEILTPNDDLTALVTIKNQWTGKIKDAYISLEIPELALVTRSTSFDLSRGEETTQTLTLPLYDVPKGVYYVRITAGNSDVRRIKYREIEVK